MSNDSFIDQNRIANLEQRLAQIGTDIHDLKRAMKYFAEHRTGMDIDAKNIRRILDQQNTLLALVDGVRERINNHEDEDLRHAHSFTTGWRRPLADFLRRLL